MTVSNTDRQRTEIVDGQIQHRARPIEGAVYMLVVSYYYCYSYYSFPGGSAGESACLCRRLRFKLWSGKIPQRRNGNPLQYPCLENLMDRGA